MKRAVIIQTIGSDYLSSNIESDEFSYPKAYAKAHKNFEKVKKGRHQHLDIRFVDDVEKFAVLVETKQNFDKVYNAAVAQLSAYVSYEKAFTGYSVIAILANTNDDRIVVWKDEVSDENLLPKEVVLRSFEEYRTLIKPKTKNNREEVMRNTYQLNELLHKYGIAETLRSQFVGTCLLALKHGLCYQSLKTPQIMAGIRSILEEMLNHNINKASKLVVLNDKVLNDQCIRELPSEELEAILLFIERKILPFINEQSTLGQDLLNLFFTTFNKYVGKKDKNQAFTPDHIVDFMCKVVGVNRHSRVLDPCCGSGAFLVRALTDAMDDCVTDAERERVKSEQIYGVEFEETAFGLATTNMLIHGDGNSNVRQGSCFDLADFVRDANINVVLMNPPYNAQRKHCLRSYTDTWKSTQKEDPSKGFHFVYEVARQVRTGKLAVLLPLQCAIGNGTEIQSFKQRMLEEHHLDAVFTLPADMFHPGASANACCMVFDLGIRHSNAPIKETFFGYFKDDGFVKRKNLGRVEKVEGVWDDIKQKWLDTYRKRLEVSGLSAVRCVTAEDEWLCEAYMETDYSTLTDEDFEQTIRDFFAYKISTGGTNA